MNHFNKISAFTQAIGIKPPEHPLFCVSHGTKFTCNLSDDIEFTTDFYIIGFQKLESGSVLYGKTKYDHDHGKMSFIKPHQIIAFKNIRLDEDCFVIAIHEDFLSGNILHHEMRKYSFFEYEANEALHLSPSEEKTIWNLVKTMEKEYRNNVDDYSKVIILSHLDTMLKYAQRFYKRQFIDRTHLRGATFTKFNDLLSLYFENKTNEDFGLPTVSYLAEKLHVSSKYLTDLLKQETGKTALELIHLYLISEAKNLLKEGKMNITEISVSLGFENATYFSRLFKKEVGMTPNIFRDDKRT
ncbi:AraC family transcriptional regulator [Flavobacterium sp. MDT1-60]|uniref:helix-turn-helix domain-containing protein n=1 Tax=Flavobacterium sp. MDT1-60 TaxID=1979344 RepID=UPI00178722E5|nr:response regulator transcription factor [Flavobacterium sp. MDT1-60]QOG02116.1 helix-turn-helix transcriptional regulator [Flavobacterium sp. MDT1-60]